MVIFGDFYLLNNRSFAIYIPLTKIYIPQLKRIEHVVFKKKLKILLLLNGNGRLRTDTKSNRLPECPR